MAIQVAVPVTVTESTEPVLVEPVIAVFAAAKTVTEPTPPVDDSPVSGTLASATTETDPTAPVPATPVTTTGRGSPQLYWDHVPLRPTRNRCHRILPFRRYG